MEGAMVRQIAAIDKMDAPIKVKSTEEPYKLEFLGYSIRIIVAT